MASRGGRGERERFQGERSRQYEGDREIQSVRDGIRGDSYRERSSTQGQWKLKPKKPAGTSSSSVGVEGGVWIFTGGAYGS